MLLQLPSELLLDILGFLDPASFYQCLLACKTILSHVRGSKKLLKQQIVNVPGAKGWELADIIDMMTASHLFAIFTDRARDNLLHAPADLTHFKLPLKRFKFGAFGRCSCFPYPHLYMALVNSKSGAIGIHRMEKGGKSTLKCIVSPHHLHLGRSEEIQFKVLKCAFAEAESTAPNKLAVLYSYRLPGTSTGAFVKQAQQQSKLFTKLVVWRLWDPTGVVADSVDDIYVGDGREPAALGVSPEGNPFVAFSSPEHALGLSPGDGWDLPTWEAEQCSAVYRDPMDPNSIVATTGRDEGLLTPSEIVVKGNRALFSFPLAPTPQWELDDYLRSNTLMSNFDSFEALARVGITRRDFGGLILADRHRCDHKANPLHVNEALQLHFQSHGEFEGAYIIKAVDISDECNPYDERLRYPNMQSKIVAQLDGLDMSASRTSSLGLILAVSVDGTRIAVASWDGVQVWTINPLAFFMDVKRCVGVENANVAACRRLRKTGTRARGADGDSSMDPTDSDEHTLDPESSESDDMSISTDSTDSTGPRPPSRNSTDTSDSSDDDDDSLSSSSIGDPNECDWLRRCGWDYYSCGGRKQLTDDEHNIFAPFDEIVKIQPVSLPRCGVVHSLKFAEEDVLWGWTDCGPVCWRLGQEVSGRKRTKFMSFSNRYVTSCTDFSSTYSNTSSIPH
ncbi:hypothetical protein IWX90DRAFT_275834 [Phyllosticta citrichinensis]|uniref:F-box domain-containing protein n=1 Tax=Phyllosticta citrichinensis TaxID=1130410 RepID=A0ABR1XN51_9PEZI